MWKLSSGATATAHIDVVKDLRSKEVNLDGDKFVLNKKDFTERTTIAVEVGGKFIAHGTHLEDAPAKLKKDGYPKVIEKVALSRDTTSKIEAAIKDAEDKAEHEAFRDFRAQQKEAERAAEKMDRDYEKHQAVMRKAMTGGGRTY